MRTLFSCTYNWEMLHQQLLWGQGGDHFSPVLVGASETDQAGGRRQDLPVGPMGRELLVPTHQLACPVLVPVLSVRSNPEGRMGKGGDGEGAGQAVYSLHKDKEILSCGKWESYCISHESAEWLAAFQHLKRIA